MNINKKCLIIKLFSLFILFTACVFPVEKDGRVNGASYFIYEGSEDNALGINDRWCGGRKYGNNVKFYTFDGNEITKMISYVDLDILLDEKAPKPQPVSCVVKFWMPTRIVLGYELVVGPKWVISFYDKNGNVIKGFRIDKEKQIIFYCSENLILKEQKYNFDDPRLSEINEDFPLDLSKITKVEIEEQQEEIDKSGALARFVRWLLNV